MSIYELQIRPYKDIILNNLTALSIDVKNINYETITNKNIPVKVNPLFFVQDKDIEIDLSSGYYINFESFGILRDLNFNKNIINDIPYYKYSGLSKKICIELHLLYAYSDEITAAPRYNIRFSINNKEKSNIYHGVYDTIRYDNLFSNKYIITIENNDIISINIIKNDISNNNNNYKYNIKEGSYICFTEI